MDEDLTMQALIALISESLSRDASDIGSDTLLIDDLGMDSMEMLGVLFDVEAHLGPWDNTPDLVGVRTVGDLMAAIGSAREQAMAKGA